MQAMYKPIVPRKYKGGSSTAPDDTKFPSPTPEEPPTKKQRKNVTVACIPCQKRKCKCNGARPVCSSCTERSLECLYNVAEGVSRRDDLENKNSQLDSKVHDYEFLFSSMRSGTDHTSTSILARIRLGDNVDDIIADLKTRSDDVSSPDSIGVSPSDQKLALRPLHRRSAPHDFFHPLFSRKDWLNVDLGASDEGQDEGSSRFTVSPVSRATTLKRRTSSDDSSISHGTKRTASPDSAVDLVQHGRTERQRLAELADRQNHILPLAARQNISEKLSLHANVRNYFLNLDFSTAIRANHHPSDVQDRQVMNLSVPKWAMLLPHSRKVVRVNDAFQTAYDGARNLQKEGKSLDEICGKHCHVAALYDVEAFNKAPFISQWCARMVHSCKQEGWSFTSFASVYIFWYVIRWIIEPSPITYEQIPEWMRPTPNQLFMPHESWVDTIIWPSFRELVVQAASMQTNTTWVINLTDTIGCEWSGTIEEALRVNPDTNETDLTPEALAAALDLYNWYLSPSFRQYVINADAYIRIKSEVTDNDNL